MQHVGRADEFAVEPIGPGMIAALDGAFEAPGCFATQTRSTVPTHIEECLKIPLFIANESVIVVRNKQGEDRKSTRLNSSHQIISYAVFCLKKKNTTR